MHSTIGSPYCNTSFAMGTVYITEYGGWDAFMHQSNTYAHNYTNTVFWGASNQIEKQSS